MSCVSGLPIMTCSTGIRRGMKSLVSLADKLSSPNKNLFTHEEILEDSLFAYEQIMAAYKQLQDQLLIVDAQIVDLPDKKLLLETEKNERQLSQDLLKIKLEHHENTRNYAEQMQRTAEQHLRELRELQKKARQDEKWYKIARNISLVFMPLSTLMAGIMSAIFQISLYTAQRTNQELQEAIGLYDTKISEYKQNVSKCDIEKKETEVNINADQKRMEEISGELAKFSDLPEKVNEKQKELQAHVRNLGLLAEDVKTLKSKLLPGTDYEEEDAWDILNMIAEQWQKTGGQELLKFLGQEEINALVKHLDHIIKTRPHDEV